jgi:hypothetical protein
MSEHTPELQEKSRKTHAPVALDPVLEVIDHAHPTDVPTADTAASGARFPAVHGHAGTACDDLELLVACQCAAERDDARGVTEEHNGPDVGVLGLNPGEEGGEEDLGPVVQVLERLTLARRVVRRLIGEVKDAFREEGRQRRGRPGPRVEGGRVGRRRRVPLAEAVLE